MNHMLVAYPGDLLKVNEIKSQDSSKRHQMTRGDFSRET